MNRPRSLVIAASAALGLTACTGGNFADTPLPTASSSSASSSSPSSTSAPATCTNATQSYDPLGSTPPASQITDSALRQIVSRGYLRVGVSADSYLLGAYNPLDGQIEGFDIDIAKAVAKALFGSESKLRLVVITAGERISALQSGEVDMVARNMTMTCGRWTDIAFSSEYYHAGQKVLVTRDNTAQSMEDLKGQKVCAPTGTTSLTKLQEVAAKVGGIDIVTASNHTGCLVLFQQGYVTAITGDDTVLAGLAAQDPYAKVTDAAAVTDEPYGLGIAKENVYFVRYVNAVLAQLRNDGGWKAIYNKWFAASLGKAPNPPAPVYGR
ncbi:MAG TPA: glutamate ABC transporter substrate-binding protein [Tetrasphaera sp.]|uniref:glutamate ABC transporter substrate-binding protein n=1 Tax=Nostocoides sp. TaxID=1917966 RepID=UPI002CD76D66|nr:glutamate ABC transporter substrate-binding protein [Tetrasphaera sp.]HNQ07568.1 glutamate ABC transporter substrate-binding protein [Tetrasphaera sp.]